MASFLKSADNTLLPAFSPLVCPDFYKTIYSSTLSESSVYVACCPDGYSLAPPSTPIPGGRYAYGGTCYSDISSVSVTKYDDKKLNGVDLFTTSASTQAYAYPIDGYALSPTVRLPAILVVYSLTRQLDRFLRHSVDLHL